MRRRYAVLSDVDGTLMHSGETERWAWTEWAVQHGLDPAPFIGAHGLRVQEKLERYAPHLGLNPATEGRQLAALVQRCPLTPTALPGALELLASTPALALVTSGRRDIVLPQMAAAGLRPLPQVIVADEDVYLGKPSSEPYLTAAVMLGVVPEQCIVLEDAPAGVLAGVRAGMAVVGVTTSTPAAELRDAGARLVVPDVAHFLWAQQRGTLDLTV